VYDDPIQKARVTFLAVGKGDALIELVAPLSDGLPVQRFLRERGGGLHRLCYDVSDLKPEIAAAAARRCVIVRRPQPAVGFQHRRIAWVFTPERRPAELLETTTPR
jgi:methylmalonyl-CoA/ethylmalonyl-CoA epimerase